MKKIILTTILALAFSCMSFAQNGGLLQRGAEDKNSSKSSSLFQREKNEGTNSGGSNSNTPIGNGVLLLTAFGTAYAIRKKNEK